MSLKICHFLPSVRTPHPDCYTFPGSQAHQEWGEKKKDQKKNQGRFKSGTQKLGMWNGECFGAEEATDGSEV